MRFFLQIIIFFMLFYHLNFSQHYLFTGSIGKFYRSSSFSINDAGFIYVADSQSNEITKLDTLGSVIRFIGGYGWEQSAFDDPVYLYASTLNVYVSDKNNNRIQIFDKDLNFLSEFKSSNLIDKEHSFAYPTCAATSGQGDFYILDSDNNRIIKYDLNGNFRFLIGSYDAGNYMLSEPKRFSIDSKNNLWVIDNSSLLQFDQFGNGILRIDLSFEPQNISIISDILLINSDDKVFIKNINDADSEITEVKLTPKIEQKIIHAAFFNSKLYVLTPKSILVYSESK